MVGAAGVQRRRGGQRRRGRTLRRRRRRWERRARCWRRRHRRRRCWRRGRAAVEEARRAGEEHHGVVPVGAQVGPAPAQVELVCRAVELQRERAGRLHRREGVRVGGVGVIVAAAGAGARGRRVRAARLLLARAECVGPPDEHVRERRAQRVRSEAAHLHLLLPSVVEVKDGEGQLGQRDGRACRRVLEAELEVHICARLDRDHPELPAAPAIPVRVLASKPRHRRGGGDDQIKRGAVDAADARVPELLRSVRIWPAAAQVVDEGASGGAAPCKAEGLATRTVPSRWRRRCRRRRRGSRRRRGRRMKGWARGRRSLWQRLGRHRRWRRLRGWRWRRQRW